ncbi:hypothetical protein A3D06_01450 [Candidatus Roizmanbacteria bacterium RIFCSPHIGHO2_02_FULL_40_9]|uniref:Proline--tRNA ligase n=2 Tax=Candidatus Roizmaniibacteriota TaxID=1752723 RepID=A0A1F7IMC6_9BACT|nr:MAG: hypothetical protein A3D06_01450 [Candidatus Roizmanbacteria bacterium RIFCSPHIGHO2_02_FULL_40_9]OGK44518.1 MAG: hypothetical protein A2957_00590 [Candidatus Roizmanbacteria bacterium RIFCSPLOWO2_01_FULL_38_11]
MKFSQGYIYAIKDTSREYDSRSHQLLIQGGFLDQVASGLYTFLPPGRNVLKKIEHIVRKHIKDLGALEVDMPSLQPKPLWEQTQRWDAVDVLYKVESRHGGEYGLAATAEEVVTPLAKKYIKSYKDLPLALFQITNKFRDEPRPKSGILRGREFRMKDLYSFHANEDDFNQFYARVIDAYLKIFKECGLEDVKITEASGGDFTNKHSHEFNVLTDAGEVDLIYCATSNKALNTEVVKNPKHPEIQCDGEIKEGKAVEVGNIFDLQYRFSKPFDFKYVDEYGKKHLILMGCYGIGTSRLIGAVVETHNDKGGMIWPKNITPFHAHLANLNSKDAKFADLIYRTLTAEGFDVLYDDRDDISAGEKLVTADLIGIPIRLVVSERTKDCVEWKERTSEKANLMTPTDLVDKLRFEYPTF